MSNTIFALLACMSFNSIIIYLFNPPMAMCVVLGLVAGLGSGVLGVYLDNKDKQ